MTISSQMTSVTCTLLAARVKDRWRRGASPNAIRVFKAWPDLLRSRTLALDLIYEEFCLRTESGDDLDPCEFCSNFPAELHDELREVLWGHLLLLVDVAEPAWPRAGSVVAGVWVKQELGRGAVSRVYLAFDLGTARWVVLKLSARPSGEARYLAQIEHPNVIQVLWERQLGQMHAVCFPWHGRQTLHAAKRRPDWCF